VRKLSRLSPMSRRRMVRVVLKLAFAVP